MVRRLQTIARVRVSSARVGGDSASKLIPQAHVTRAIVGQPAVRDANDGDGGIDGGAVLFLDGEGGAAGATRYQDIPYRCGSVIDSDYEVMILIHDVVGLAVQHQLLARHDGAVVDERNVLPGSRGEEQKLALSARANAREAIRRRRAGNVDPSRRRQHNLVIGIDVGRGYLREGEAIVLDKQPVNRHPSGSGPFDKSVSLHQQGNQTSVGCVGIVPEGKRPSRRLYSDDFATDDEVINAEIPERTVCGVPYLQNLVDDPQEHVVNWGAVGVLYLYRAGVDDVVGVHVEVAGHRATGKREVCRVVRVAQPGQRPVGGDAAARNIDLCLRSCVRGGDARAHEINRGALRERGAFVLNRGVARTGPGPDLHPRCSAVGVDIDLVRIQVLILGAALRRVGRNAVPFLNERGAVQPRFGERTRVSVQRVRRRGDGQVLSQLGATNTTGSRLPASRLRLEWVGFGQSQLDHLIREGKKPSLIGGGRRGEGDACAVACDISRYAASHVIARDTA